MKTDISDLRQRIMSEARSRIPVPPAEDEVTANMLAKEEGCTRQQAMRILKSMLEDEMVAVRENGIEDGKMCKVYRSI